MATRSAELGALESEVRALASEAVTLLGQAERAALVDTASTALANLGYRDIALAETNGASALVATRGPAVVGLRILDGGMLAHDHLGLSGTACVAAGEELLAELGRRGVAIISVSRRYHGDDAAVSLLARAGAVRAASGGTLAGALAGLEDAESCPVPAAGAASSARQRV